MVDFNGIDFDYLRKNPSLVLDAFRNDGFTLVDESDVQYMREELEKKPNPKLIIAQAGGEQYAHVRRRHNHRRRK